MLAKFYKRVLTKRVEQCNKCVFSLVHRVVSSTPCRYAETLLFRENTVFQITLIPFPGRSICPTARSIPPTFVVNHNLEYLQNRKEKDISQFFHKEPPADISLFVVNWSNSKHKISTHIIGIYLWIIQG
jgi:hypothetical protein